MALITINNVVPASPDSIQISIMDLDGDTYRDSGGTIYRERITVKRKLTCHWAVMNEKDMAQLLGLVKGEFFKVTYPDPQSGQIETRTFYVGDRNVPSLVAIRGRVMWKELQMNFIER